MRAASFLFPLILALFLPLLSPALAFINPHFTPIHLVKQSESILHLEAGPVTDQTKLPVRLVATVKGRAEPPTLEIHKLDTPVLNELRRAFRPGRTETALLFRGQYKDLAAEGHEEPGPAALHVGGKWFRLTPGAKAGVWEVGVVDEPMQGVWNGGSDMLLRAVKYVLADPQPEVPVRAEAGWELRPSQGPQKLGLLEGKVHGVMAVASGGDGRLRAFILADSGDRLLSFDMRATNPVVSRKLSSQSRAAAWGDFDGDGRLDFCSHDGTALKLWRQTDTAAFVPVGSGHVLAQTVLGLSTLSVRTGAAVLVSTPAWPLLLIPQPEGMFVVADLAGNRSPAPLEFGAARACLVADFDGDAQTDVLQSFAKGARFFKGRLAGGFEAPVMLSHFHSGDGPAAGFTGDFDADGLLDVFFAGDRGCFVWHNLGGGQFEEVVDRSGEVAYLAKPDALGGVTCDINNDGRQDVLLLYRSALAPQLFFNRGFRSFGIAENLDLKAVLPAAAEGQQAGTVADFNGDGAQDLLLVLNTGEMWFVPREVRENPALAVQVILPHAARGPLSITASRENRSFGAWNLAPGSGSAFFGISEPGPLILQWRPPGGALQRKNLVLEQGLVRCVLP